MEFQTPIPLPVFVYNNSITRGIVLNIWTFETVCYLQTNLFGTDTKSSTIYTAFHYASILVKKYTVSKVYNATVVQNEGNNCGWISQEKNKHAYVSP